MLARQEVVGFPTNGCVTPSAKPDEAGKFPKHMKITVALMAGVGLAFASLTIVDPVHATPLRELMFDATAQEHHGLLTKEEIKAARLLGAVSDHRHILGTELGGWKHDQPTKPFRTITYRQQPRN